jgi:hypothetical protein
LVVLGDEAVDGGLEFDERSEDAVFKATARSLAKKPLTTFSLELEVGVKWNTKRGLRASHRFTSGVLWTASLSMIAWTTLPAGMSRSRALR